MFPSKAINDKLSGYPRARPAVAAGLTLLVLMLAALATLYLLAKSQASEQAQAQAERLANSVETLLTPLMLADDRVSLNFVANQLVGDPSLRGIRLTDSQSLAVAVAGEPAELKLIRQITPNGELLGELTLWIDPMPTLGMLQSQLSWVAIAFFVALAAATLTYRYTPSGLAIIETTYDDENEPEDFQSQLAQAYDPAAETEGGARTDSNSEESLDAYTYSESNDEHGDHPTDVQTDHAQVADRQQSNDEDAEDPDAPVSFDTLSPAESQERTDPTFNIDAADPLDEADEPLDVSETLKAPVAPIPVVKSQVPQTNPDDERVDLVDLLRPEHDQSISMPKFKPSAMQPLEDSVTEEPESEELEITIPIPVNTAPRSRKLPIITEEQLDLYTLEQELDLILSPETAGYLILIDTTSAHSANLDAQEQAQIRRTYRTLANSVARIYYGTVELLGDDIQIRFDLPKSDDSHGVNAVCSAMLFNLLYRSYNQSRSKQNLPLLNVHTAVVRGQLEKFGHMLDEARFLTRSTNSNQVVSHTALSEAPELKANLLSSADIRREDEDKVLINSIEKRHQALLEKQARYLLAKLADRANQRARTGDSEPT
ncbi:MAG: hypothetical protein HWE12_15150 [Oceanospirillaceae bacterium]|nr:hypothetical protein [Oceanospirillaceae bacterium]